MRGKGTEHRQNYRQNRITPAYAGKSFGLFDLCCYCQDHPRLCGEKVMLEPWHMPTWGSPPPMRGKGSSCFADFAFAGITPAYAGKSKAKIMKARLMIGSPPPMRGKDFFVVQPCTADGITPAYAGKSFAYAEAFPVAEDHPRLCGEKFSVHAFSFSSMGSPPPMRGKDLSAGQLRRTQRITPAYAGKSAQITSLSRFLWDHPRLCGEKLDHQSQLKCMAGSPPPMRGKGQRRSASESLQGITPAYAGKSGHRSTTNFRRRDHPRLCGEKPKMRVLQMKVTGSPPPMRGKGAFIAPRL